MLNEGTSIAASFSVSVRLMEGTHESPARSLYGLKDVALCHWCDCSKSRCLPKHASHLLKWRREAFFFSRNVERALACARVEILTQF